MKPIIKELSKLIGEEIGDMNLIRVLRIIADKWDELG